MTHPSTITNAILAQNGNHDPDEYYPAPLTCTECCARPDIYVMATGNVIETPKNRWSSWRPEMKFYYVTTDDPLPDGWVTRTNEQWGFTSTLCPACVERVKHGDE